MSAVTEAVANIVAGNSGDPSVTREDWIAGVNRYFDEEQARQDWTDDAENFSGQQISYNSVEIVAVNHDGGTEYRTGFRITPEQAWSMFTGIRDNYKGDD